MVIWASVGNGALAGAGSGGVASLINGQNFLEGVLKGAVIGGAIAGISYTINYLVKYSGMDDEFKFASNENSSSNGNSQEYSDKTLKDMRNKYFKPIEKYKYRVAKDVTGSSEYSITKNGFFSTTKGNAYAYTTRPNFFTLKSTIHYAPAAFSSKELLFTTMLHETAHSYAMFGGNIFIQYAHDKKIFGNSYGVSGIDTVGHAAIYDLENYMSDINHFGSINGIGMDSVIIKTAINNGITGNNTKDFYLMRNFLIEIFNRKIK